MSKVLYVTANPKDMSASKSLEVGQVFLESYRKNNPTDVVEMIDLYDLDLPDIDYDVMSAFGKFAAGEDLSSHEGSLMTKREVVLEQFLSADKIVFVTPMWNFSYPSVVKKYIDVIVAAGRTVKYTEEGVPVGLVEGKKVLHIQASGGDYSARGVEATKSVPALSKAQNFGNLHLEGALMFIGISDYTHLYVSNQAIPGVSTETFERKKEEARVLGVEF